MRKHALLLYKNEQDKVFLETKVQPLPWLSCRSLSQLEKVEENEMIITCEEDLSGLLKLKNKMGRYTSPPVLILTPHHQLVVFRMVESSRFRIVERAVSSKELGELVLSLVQKTSCTSCFEKEVCHLTIREKQVLSLIVLGQDNRIIAQKLGIQLSTVYAHKKNLFLKTQVHTTSQLVVWALLKQLDV